MDENSSNWVYSEYTTTGRTGSMQLNVFHVIIKNTPKHVWSAELCIQEMLTLHAILLPKIILPKKSQKNKLKPKDDPSILLTTWSPEYPTPPRSTLSQSKFLTSWAAPALFLPTRTARIDSFICLSCSWFVGNSIHCSIKLRFHLNMVCWSVLTVASFSQGQIVQSWVKITQDKCKIWIQIWKSKKANSL